MAQDPSIVALMESRRLSRSSIIGERLLLARKRAKMQSGEVTRAIGRGRNALNVWESGKQSPPVDVVAELADLYRVDANWLLGRDRGVLIDEEIAHQILAGDAHGQDALKQLSQCSVEITGRGQLTYIEDISEAAQRLASIVRKFLEQNRGR